MRMIRIRWVAAALLTATVLAAATSRLTAQKEPTTRPAAVKAKKGRACGLAGMRKADKAQLSEAIKAIDEAARAVESGNKEATLAALARAKKLVGAARDRMGKRGGTKACAKGCRCPKCVAKAKAPKAAAKCVNAKCPMMGGAIDPANVPAKLTRQFKGRKVGFCCAGCPTAWDKLSDAKKQTKLDKARAK